jgi:hypothetical protein
MNKDTCNVGELRRGSALADYKEPIVIVLVHDNGKKMYYRASEVWPDTSQAPAGRAFYVLAHAKDEVLI